MKKTRTRKKRRKTTKKIGVSLFAVLLLALPALAQEATVAGTVFREPGFAVPRAEVVLACVACPHLKKPLKGVKQVADARGEFYFHVPAGKARYSLTAKAAGLESETKEIDVHSSERVDVYFQLKPQRKQVPQ